MMKKEVILFPDKRLKTLLSEIFPSSETAIFRKSIVNARG